MALAQPDGLPQGLVGLYERWFRRQFPDVAGFETFRPLFEVLVAAEHPVPEVWLERIFGWSKRERAKMLEGLGSLFDKSKDGVAPFHKSLRDWFTDDHSTGPDFVIDADVGSDRLIRAFCEKVESGIPMNR